MKVLGIETSCDETSVAVLDATGDRFRVLANVVSSQVATHAPFGGVVPSLAAREHGKNISHVFEAALQEAEIQDPENEIDLIAVTYGPGLGPALLIGLMFARTLAWRWNIPLVGVNHLDGHIHSNWLTEDKKTKSEKRKTSIDFPALNLIVSGGHTELVLMPASPAGGQDHEAYTILGETRDDAVGEAFDKVARLLGLGYPGGPRITKLAQDGDSSAYALPRPMAKDATLDFSYSGLKTAVLYLIRDLGENLSDKQKADIAASFQEAAIDVLIQKVRRAAREVPPKSILISGGVSANTLLREKIKALGNELRIPVFLPDLAYTGDNAAMIAAAGYFLSKKKKTDSSWESVRMDANARLGSLA